MIARSRDEPSLFAVLFDRHARHIHRYLARRLVRRPRKRATPNESPIG